MTMHRREASCSCDALGSRASRRRHPGATGSARGMRVAKGAVVAFGTYLKQIARRGEKHGELAPEEAAQAFGAMLDGGVPELEVGAMLVALRMKSESLNELLGCYEALGERVHRLEPLAGTVRT